MTTRRGWGALLTAVWLVTSAGATASQEDAAPPAAGTETGAQEAAAAQDPAAEAGRARQAPALARRLGLPLPLAARLAALLTLEITLCDHLLREDEDAHAAAIQDVESKFITLLSLAPENRGLADEVHDFYSNCSGEAGGTEVLDLIARARDPVAMALRLAGVHPDRREDHPNPSVPPPAFVDHSSHHARSTDFLLAALSARPAATGLWVYAAQATFRQEWQIALFEQALRSLLSPDEAPSQKRTAAAAAIAQSMLRAAIDAGLAARAITELRGLRPAVRALVESGRRGYVYFDMGGIFVRPYLSDLRLELGMAAVLAGDLPAARSLLVRFDAGRAPVRQRDALLRGTAMQRRLLDSWLQRRAEDPFDLLTTAVGLSRKSDATFMHSVGWQLTLARAAVREGYAGIAVFELPRAAENLVFMTVVDEPAPTGRDVPPRVLHSAQGLVAEVEALQQEIETELRAARIARHDALGPDPAAAAIARWLERPPGPPFAARRLPPGIPPLDLSAVQRDAARAFAERLRLPAGFTPVRAERQQEELAVIARSEAYDPRSLRAEDGGYWVLRSGDGGKTWRRPLYTGLRVNLPYTVREESALPLQAGDRLQVEVEIKPLDLELAYTAAELARRPGESGIYLEIPFADLERDSDGDGLTDLAEQRLLTDPGNPDTNGDGTLDGDDRAPAIPPGDPASPAARFIATLVKGTGIADSPTAAVSRNRGGAGSRAPLPEERTFFGVGERRWFSGLRPAHRMIVLTDEEWLALNKQISLPYDFGFDILVFDRSGHRAFVLNGGARTYEDRDGVWQQVD
jgi:hypothetical protein